MFDCRHFGSSAGEPRGQLFPLGRIEDFRNAVSWASGRADLDDGRIGLWGTSFSGGLIAYVATDDKRVRAVVAQVPSRMNTGHPPRGGPGETGRGRGTVADRPQGAVQDGVVNMIGHFGVCQDPWLTEVADQAVGWFDRHLS